MRSHRAAFRIASKQEEETSLCAMQRSTPIVININLISFFVSHFHMEIKTLNTVVTFRLLPAPHHYFIICMFLHRLHFTILFRLLNIENTNRRRCHFIRSAAFHRIMQFAHMTYHMHLSLAHAAHVLFQLAKSISIREQKVNTTEVMQLMRPTHSEHKENRSNARVLHVVIMTTIKCIYIQIYKHILAALFARGYGTNAHSWRIQDASKHNSVDSPNKFFAIDLFVDTIRTVFDRQWKRE